MLYYNQKMKQGKKDGSSEKAESEGRGKNRHELAMANYMVRCTIYSD